MPGTSRRAVDVRRGKTARTTPRALSRIVWLSASPVALRSSVIIASPERIAWRGERGRSGLPSSSISPRVNGRTPKTASSSSVRPEPCSPEMPTISPARRVRSTPSTYPLPALRQLEHRPRRARCRAALSGKNDGDRPADHQPDQRRVVELGGGLGGDLLAVLEHGDGVAEVEDLLEPVGDVDDADAALGEPGDDAVEQLDLVVGEGRGGLVHLDHPGVEADRLGDLDDLLLGDAQRAHPLAGPDVGDAEVAEQVGGVGAASGRCRRGRGGAARGRARRSRRPSARAAG